MANAWNREYIRNHVKSANTLARATNDGLLSDIILNEAIESALKLVGWDCNLKPKSKTFPLVADQYSYPMDERVSRIRKVWYTNSSNVREPLVYLPVEAYMDWENPANTVSKPTYYSYPMYQGRVYQFYADAPPIYDYLPSSYITTASIRTVIDSGMNFGKTLSGRRVRPECVVYNVTDDSYGYISHLNMGTVKTTGTATANTSSTILEDTTADFVTDAVAVDDIICLLSGTEVTAYAFVTAVDTTQLTYISFEKMSQSAILFASGDSYKVGKADEIWLSTATPHPGLRDGAKNYFYMSSVACTMTGTTFTNTRCTGSSTSGASTGQVAIASGGSHGLITTVDDNYIVVDKWIGGKPVDAETVAIYTADKYQVQDKFTTERALWIGPTIDSSDSAGEESITVLYNERIQVPDEDDDPLEVDEMYEQPVLRCSEWQTATKTGIYSIDELIKMEMLYRNTVQDYRGDVSAPPLGPINPLNNRGGRGRIGYQNQTPNGLRWNISDRS